MRAHFAGIPTTPDSVDKIEPVPLEARIMEFKQDTKNMEILTEFIDDVLLTAEQEATKQNADKQAKKSQQPKDKSRQSFSIPDFKNGKVVNRARGFVVKIFDAICNCANNAAAAPTQRFKLRSKRQATPLGTATTAASAEGGAAGGAGVATTAIGSECDAGADAVPPAKEPKVAKNSAKDVKEKAKDNEKKSHAAAAATTGIKFQTDGSAAKGIQQAADGAANVEHI